MGASVWSEAIPDLRDDWGAAVAAACLEVAGGEGYGAGAGVTALHRTRASAIDWADAIITRVVEHRLKASGSGAARGKAPRNPAAVAADAQALLHAWLLDRRPWPGFFRSVHAHSASRTGSTDRTSAFRQVQAEIESRVAAVPGLQALARTVTEVAAQWELLRLGVADDGEIAYAPWSEVRPRVAAVGADPGGLDWFDVPQTTGRTWLDLWDDIGAAFRLYAPVARHLARRGAEGDAGRIVTWADLASALIASADYRRLPGAH